MAKRVPAFLTDQLGAFLRRQEPALSEEEAGARMRRLVVRGERAPFVLGNAPAPSVPVGAIVAAELSPAEVRERLEKLTQHVVAQLLAGDVPSFELPDLHRNNAIYDDRGDVFLGPACRPLAFDRKGAKDFLRLLIALETASENVRDRSTTTKRGLFYRHRAALHDADDQRDSDRAITSLANVLRVRRRALGFVAARRGWAVGRLVIRRGGETINLAKVGAEGELIPRIEDGFEIVESDARVIVVVEKDAIANRLAQEQWWDATGSILLCGSGFPSLATREVLWKLIERLRIPAILFADADPWGVQLALNYTHGSISTALETPWLACNALSWGGFWPSEIERLTTKRDRITLAAEDREAALALAAHPSRTHVPKRVREELSALVDVGVKVELDALNHGRRLGDYLTRKVADGEAIKL